MEAAAAVPMPAGLDDAQAAALPLAYAAAWYAAHHVARVRAGERVLVHAGPGSGAGPAAVAVAAAAGAEVCATAESERLRQTPRRLGAARVVDPRDLLDVAETPAAGSGAVGPLAGGVDVVLDATPGTAPRAGLELLSVRGRFVEIGLPGASADGPGGRRFRRAALGGGHRNITVAGVDLAGLLEHEPRLAAAVLREVWNEVAAGRLGPLPVPGDTPDGTAGRRVVAFPREGGATAVVPPEDVTVFRGDCAYVVTGGPAASSAEPDPAGSRHLDGETRMDGERLRPELRRAADDGCRAGRPAPNPADAPARAA